MKNLGISEMGVKEDDKIRGQILVLIYFTLREQAEHRMGILYYM